MWQIGFFLRLLFAGGDENCHSLASTCRLRLNLRSWYDYRLAIYLPNHVALFVDQLACLVASDDSDFADDYDVVPQDATRTPVGFGELVFRFTLVVKTELQGCIATRDFCREPTKMAPRTSQAHDSLGVSVRSSSSIFF